MTRVPFSIFVVDDSTLEKNENLRLTIDPILLPDNVTVGVPNRAKVRIVDDDGM